MGDEKTYIMDTKTGVTSFLVTIFGETITMKKLEVNLVVTEPIAVGYKVEKKYLRSLYQLLLLTDTAKKMSSGNNWLTWKGRLKGKDKVQ